MRNCFVVLALAAAVGSASCRPTDSPAGAGPPAPASVNADAALESPAPAAGPRIVALGDSLTAGLGLTPEQAYPALLQQRLDAAGLDYEVVNAGSSGDTSAGGLSRLEWALAGDVRVLILALGGNDALRGLPPEELRRNLGQIIERAQARRIAVVLAGMEAPPNFGTAYVVSFHQVYPDLAAQYGVPLVPFLLNRVAGVESLNQRDGIHPTAEGQKRVAENVWKVLQTLL